MTKKRIIRLFLFVFLMICMYAVGYSYGQSLCSEDDFNYIEDTLNENPVLDSSYGYNSVASAQDMVVKSSTRLFIEEYNLDDDSIKMKEEVVPIFLLGLTRTEVLESLDEMQEYYEEEDNIEIVDYMLMDFSESQMVVRKNVREKELETETDIEETSIPEELTTDYKYYMVLRDDKIIVYDTEKKEVFIETSISIDILDEDSKEKLTTGILIKNISELYRMLESFTS